MSLKKVVDICLGGIFPEIVDIARDPLAIDVEHSFVNEPLLEGGLVRL